MQNICGVMVVGVETRGNHLKFGCEVYCYRKSAPPVL